MTPDQIHLVRESYGYVDNGAPAFARTFYERLFEIDPSIRPLFPADLAAQGAKLMAVLGLVVGALDRLEPLLPTIERLAHRHVNFGVAERHYPSVGMALIWTLDRALGEAFSAETRAAWIIAFGILSTTMIAAARAGAEPVG